MQGTLVHPEYFSGGVPYKGVAVDRYIKKYIPSIEYDYI